MDKLSRLCGMPQRVCEAIVGSECFTIETGTMYASSPIHDYTFYGKGLVSTGVGRYCVDTIHIMPYSKCIVCLLLSTQ